MPYFLNSIATKYSGANWKTSRIPCLDYNKLRPDAYHEESDVVRSLTANALRCKSEAF